MENTTAYRLAENFVLTGDDSDLTWLQFDDKSGRHIYSGPAEVDEAGVLVHGDDSAYHVMIDSHEGFDETMSAYFTAGGMRLPVWPHAKHYRWEDDEEQKVYRVGSGEELEG